MLMMNPNGRNSPKQALYTPVQLWALVILTGIFIALSAYVYLAQRDAGTPVEISRTVGEKSFRININEAMEEDLVLLPGIGPAKAKKIVELRERLGGFDKVETLLEVNGINTKTLEKIKPYLLIDP